MQMLCRKNKFKVINVSVNLWETFFFFSVFEKKQAKRIMTNPKPPSNGPPPSMVVGDHYRVWSLTGQGFLTFIPTDGAKKEKNADCSGTGKETSSE